jgi:hypothetical protein
MIARAPVLPPHDMKFVGTNALSSDRLRSGFRTRNAATDERGRSYIVDRANNGHIVPIAGDTKEIVDGD